MGDGGDTNVPSPPPREGLASFFPFFLPLKNYLVAAFLFLIILAFYLLIFVCTGSSLLHLGFLELQCRGGCSLVPVNELLIVVASLVAEHGLLQFRLSSYGAQA